MASNSPRKRLQEESTCHICWKYYVNPWSLECGHNFCMACVSQCWKEFPDNAACPQCRTAVQRKNCRLNTLLANVVEIAKQLNIQGEKEAPAEKICKKHPEPSRTVFCEEDQVVFCQACEGSEQHRDHCVAPVEESAQLYKDCYSRYIEVLKEERTELVKRKFLISEWGEQLKKKSDTDYEIIAAGFRKLHDFLINQEDYVMIYSESVPRMIAEKKNHALAHLSLDIFLLENNIRLLEEKASQPVHEFLQGAMNTFNRCHRKPRLPREDVSLDLKWSFWGLMEMSAVVKGLANYFTDTLQNACSVDKVNVTLDRDSNHPQLLLSPDGKSIKWTQAAAQLPNSYKRFEKLQCVVGCQELTVGRYFWEVVVKGRGEWAVGVAKSSMRRKGFFNLCAKEGVFAVGKLEQEYRVINVPHSPLLPLDGELRRIRVSLNCSAGQVNFYDVVRAMRILEFTEIGCFRETFLPFFWLNGQTQIIISQ